MDEIDRWFSELGATEPAPDLSARIMRAERREAATPAPIGLPWGRLCVGLAASAACLAMPLLAAVGHGFAFGAGGAQLVALVVLTLGLCQLVARAATY